MQKLIMGGALCNLERTDTAVGSPLVKGLCFPSNPEQTAAGSCSDRVKVGRGKRIHFGVQDSFSGAKEKRSERG